MLRDVAFGILSAILQFLLRMEERSRTAIDAARDLDLMRRAGARVRGWLRSNRARARIESVQDRTRDASADLRDD